MNTSLANGKRACNFKHVSLRILTLTRPGRLRCMNTLFTGGLCVTIAVPTAVQQLQEKSGTITTQPHNQTPFQGGSLYQPSSTLCSVFWVTELKVVCLQRSHSREGTTRPSTSSPEFTFQTRISDPPTLIQKDFPVRYLFSDQPSLSPPSMPLHSR
ncbi:uncharacterized protein EKO05_0010119 [Ascochyta rabiei]|uniref:uncharacterized protein n=1 Tax=Didymella rabiei TaxID=5454 RepID=UPI002201650F|nr:uncharacterized protein EKO05_0010119 [Ascochyta rabiei]UPX19868.1 hypothetical protein EKO05_0010119 [Ascochyta rabiei]